MASLDIKIVSRETELVSECAYGKGVRKRNWSALIGWKWCPIRMLIKCVDLATSTTALCSLWSPGTVFVLKQIKTDMRWLEITGANSNTARNLVSVPTSYRVFRKLPLGLTACRTSLREARRYNAADVPDLLADAFLMAVERVTALYRFDTYHLYLQRFPWDYILVRPLPITSVNRFTQM
ncbi:unnamed protein product [Angiostrongylus costaricensis]|uniref:PINc domain-containing protein n=1 Tax=Angiostrongylus costaricensis TaxID=334426 RepID=A0A0R3PL59_ANGCS|nr:unnamed protein product [Angiostrongylus costaricensis]